LVSDFFFSSPIPDSKVRSLRSASVGAKPTSPGRRAPRLALYSFKFIFEFAWVRSLRFTPVGAKPRSPGPCAPRLALYSFKFISELAWVRSLRSASVVHRLASFLFRSF